MQSPVTVTILVINGLPYFTALQMEIMVSTLFTTQPASAGSIEELMALPVVA